MDMPPIPPAVVQFAKDNNCKVLERNEFWNEKYPYKGYKYVYNVEPLEKKEGITAFNIILVKGKKIRFATTEELLEMVQIYY